MQMWNTHTLPLVSIIMNFLVTDIVFVRHHQKQVCVIGVTYILINFYVTKSTGQPVYHFMTWETPVSIFIAAGIIGGGVLFYNILVTLSEKIKGKTVNSQKMM